MFLWCKLPEDVLKKIETCSSVSGLCVRVYINASAVVGVTVKLFINTGRLILLRHVFPSGSELCGPLSLYIPSFYGCKAEWRTVPPQVHSCLSENKVVCKRRTLTSTIVSSNRSCLSLNFDKNNNFNVNVNRTNLYLVFHFR